MSRYSDIPIARCLTLALVAALSGCSDTIPTGPAPPSVPTSLSIFPVHLDPLGQAQFFFQLVEAPAPLRVTLAGTTTDGQTRALDAALSLRVGVPDGDGCLDTLAATTTAALTAQVSGTLPIGTYCVQVKDTGTLSEPADVTVRLHIQPPAGQDSTGTETFASNLALDGFSSKSFVVRQSGNTTATLESLGGPAGTTVIVGIGVQGAIDVGCRLGVLARLSAGGVISAPVDPGFYCVAVLGLSADQPQNQTAFSVTVAHP